MSVTARLISTMATTASIITYKSVFDAVGEKGFRWRSLRRYRGESYGLYHILSIDYDDTGR